MKKYKLEFIYALILSATLPAFAQAETTSCRVLDVAYSACGRHFERVGADFRFHLGNESRLVPCQDNLNLDFYERIDRMDMHSVLSIPYEAGTTELPERRRNWDPGRLREENLLRATYGNSEAEVRARLVPVQFLGQRILFQSRLGAARALERVGQELETAAASDPSLASFLRPFTSGATDLRQYGFVWRFVKGTTRLSTHSFGTGIDLLLPSNGPQYWLWDEQAARPELAREGEQAYRNIHFIPRAAPRFHATAIAIFERNGFIWGGKWNHYDTMHFEYRPEFFAEYRPDCGGRSGFSGDFSLEDMENPLATEQMHDH